MAGASVWKIGEFEFNTESGRLRRSGGDGVLLGENETRLLTFLITNFGNESRRKAYNDKIIAYIWKGAAVSNYSLQKSVEFLRDAFGEARREYVLTKPYRLFERPQRLDVDSPFSPERREFVISGFGVAAYMRYGQCLVSSAI